MEKQIAKRYARAFASALKSDSYQSAREELQVLLTVFSDEELNNYLHAPGVSDSRKIEIFEKVLKDKVGSEVLNLLKVLVHRKRLDLITNVIDATLEEFNRLTDVELGTVYTPVELSSNQLQELESELGKKLGSKVIFKQVVDPELIAGYRIEVAGKLLDNSIKTQLERLETALLG